MTNTQEPMTNTDEVVERLRKLVTEGYRSWPDDAHLPVPIGDVRALIEALSTRPLQVPTPELDSKAIDAICDEALRLVAQDGAGNLTWQAAYLAVMLTGIAMSQKAAPAAPSEEALREALEQIARGRRSAYAVHEGDCLCHVCAASPGELRERARAALAAPPQKAADEERNGE